MHWGQLLNVHIIQQSTLPRWDLDGNWCNLQIGCVFFFLKDLPFTYWLFHGSWADLIYPSLSPAMVVIRLSDDCADAL
jgi:hypothetical protein